MICLRINRSLIIATLASMFFIACTESGLDPETAEVVIGDDVDTLVGPSLAKAVVKAGIVGDGLNSVVQDFVSFRHVTKYAVDTLDDGSVLGVRGLRMMADLGTGGIRAGNPFYPITGLHLRANKLLLRVNGLGDLRDLVGDPDGSGVDQSGIKATLASGTSLWVREGDLTSYGEARIESVNSIDRLISVSVNAKLQNPNREEGTDYVHLEILLELPF